ncbi:MAG TPA: hypothetical protein DCG30_06830 [Ruminococcus sp.]|nr:hypothetical protein [Ruminococcus sp.]
MNISKNIEYILGNDVKWELFTNKSYQAQIQKANPEKIYNVPDKNGVVYNCLEDSFEKVPDTGYIVTGAASEMWCIPEKALAKYKIEKENITGEPQPVMTVETGAVLAGVKIPVATKFTLEVDYGEKAVLKGNREGIEHGEGDYVLVCTKLENGQYVPDFEDSGRIVNGAVFDILYKKYEK